MTAEPSLTQIEEETRRFWERDGIPEFSRAIRRDGPPFLIYQQPLPVVGQPWVDHVRLLCTGDLLARYHAMKGEAVHHQIGWSCHGLPVEVAVERSLEPHAVDYDLAQFNATCRSAAVEGVRHADSQARRLGVWLDPACTYASLAPWAVGAVWGALHQLSDLGRLTCEHRMVSVCPRCGTPLSASEAGLLTSNVEAQAAWVRLPWDGEPGCYLLTYAPNPWMLLGVVAVAVHPNAGYALVELARGEDQPPLRLLLAEAALERTITDDFRLVRGMKGKALRGSHYAPPFTYLPAGEGTDRVILSKDVRPEQGTGILPVTPAFDGLSLAMAQTHGLPMPKLLDEQGRLDDTVRRWRGLTPMDAEPFLLDDLATRGLLFDVKAEQRSCARCPYCETALLPMARSVWQVDTERGPWIVGRDRSWGAPLPVWTCESCGEHACLAGLDDLAYRTGQDAGQIDPHRPDVDRMTFPCGTCGGTMRRVAAVVDATFESAVLPWATAPQPGPADLAVGLNGRSPGWLDDLNVLAALVSNSRSWEEAVTLPEDDGRDDNNSDRTAPADAQRWAVYTGTTVDEAELRFLRPLWQTASLAASSEVQARPPAQEESTKTALLDRWLLARLHQAISTVTDALDAHDPCRAARELAAFVGAMAIWHVPRRPGGARDVLEIVSRLSAPFIPHLAEAIHRQLSGRSAGSVHLAGWPAAERLWEDPELVAQMALVQRLARVGQTARSEASIERDLLLPRALLGPLSGDETRADRLGPYEGLLAEVLAVDEARVTPDAVTHVEWRLVLDRDRAITRNADPAEIDAALEALSPKSSRTMASQLLEGLSVSVGLAGQAITLLPEEVVVTWQPEPGWTAAVEGTFLVILETGSPIPA